MTRATASHRQPIAPTVADGPYGVPAHTSDKAPDPFPYSPDIIGTPLRSVRFIAPHRLAQTTRDYDAAYNGMRAGHGDIPDIRESLQDQVCDVVVLFGSGVLLLGLIAVCLL